MSSYVAEFFGTLLLIVLGDGVVAGVILRGTKSENAGWLLMLQKQDFISGKLHHSFRFHLFQQARNNHSGCS